MLLGLELAGVVNAVGSRSMDITIYNCDPSRCVYGFANASLNLG